MNRDIKKLLKDILMLKFSLHNILGIAPLCTAGLNVKNSHYKIFFAILFCVWIVYNYYGNFDYQFMDIIYLSWLNIWRRG